MFLIPLEEKWSDENKRWSLVLHTRLPWYSTFITLCKSFLFMANVDNSTFHIENWLTTWTLQRLYWVRCPHTSLLQRFLPVHPHAQNLHLPFLYSFHHHHNNNTKLYKNKELLRGTHYYGWCHTTAQNRNSNKRFPKGDKQVTKFVNNTINREKCWTKKMDFNQEKLIFVWRTPNTTQILL